MKMWNKMQKIIWQKWKSKNTKKVAKIKKNKRKKIKENEQKMAKINKKKLKIKTKKWNKFVWDFYFIAIFTYSFVLIYKMGRFWYIFRSDFLPDTLLGG